MIVALTAKSLEEAQKGAFLVDIFKVVAALVLIFPGVIARNIFGDQLLSNPDSAYSALVRTVLPQILNGVFAAAIFGAILFAVIGTLMSISTSFSLDFYKGMLNQKATNKKVTALASKIMLLFQVVVYSLLNFWLLSDTNF